MIISKKISEAFPYYYFALYGVLMSVGILLREQGVLWAMLYLFIGSIFLIQWRYQFKHINEYLAFVTILFSLWMLLAAYSDIIKHENLTLSFNLFFVIGFVTLNFLASIKLAMK
jgi:hypothetical protein